jgi:hypothetical protein
MVLGSVAAHGLVSITAGPLRIERTVEALFACWSSEP